KIARIAARAVFVDVHREDRSANRNGAGRSRTSCAHVAEYRQRDLLFPSSESKTIPFKKDGRANVLSFGEQTCRPWQYARKRRKNCQTLSKRHRPNLRKVLPISLCS